MISKFFIHGKNGSGGVMDYMLGADRNREGASVLRGDPQLVASVIDSLHEQKHQYTSGVLSYSEFISDADKQAAMDAYERFLSANGAVDLSITWIEHTDKGRTELNFIVANVDLNTGRAYTPYVDSMDFGVRSALDDYLNTQSQDLDPDDPANKRIGSSAHDYIKNSKDRKALIISIDKHLEQSAQERIASGEAWTRKDTIAELKNLGFEITRQNQKGLSIGHPDLQKNVRLKGAIYEQDTRLDSTSAEKNERASQSYRKSTESRAKQAYSDFESRLAKRSERVTERYKASDKTQQAYYQNNIATSTSNNRVVASAGVSADDIHSDQVRAGLHDAYGRKESNLDASGNDLQLLKRRQQKSDLHATQLIPCFYKNRKIGDVIDNGKKLTAKDFKSHKAAAFNIVIQGKAKGWKQMHFFGNDAFLRASYEYALKNNIEIQTLDKHQEQLLRQVIEDDRIRKNAIEAAREADRASNRFEQTSNQLDRAIGGLNESVRELEYSANQFKQSVETLEQRINNQEQKRERDKGLQMSM